MSLTSHQKNNTSTWKAIDALIDHNKVVDTVNQINAVCQSKKIIKLPYYPEDYDFLLLGKAVIYGYVFSKHPKHYHKTIVGRSHYDFSFVLEIEDIVKRSIAAAYCENLVRKGKPVVHGFLSAGSKAINGTFDSSSLKYVYDDLSLLIGNMPTLEESPGLIDFNVVPHNACVVGGADIQMQLNNNVWSIHTSLKHQPLSVDKFKQQLAYFLLDYEFEDGETFSGYDSIGFYFSRHNNFVNVNYHEYLSLSNGSHLLSMIEEHLAEINLARSDNPFH